MFLWYLLHEEKESLLSKFFHAQLSSPGKGDWVLTVQEDIVTLELSMDMEGITATSQSRFKSLVRHQVKKKAFDYLQSLQATHSKSKVIKYSKLQLQSYLQPGTEKFTIQEKQFTFRARTRTLDLLGNFKTGKQNIDCRACGKAPELQPHLLQCDKLANFDVISEPIVYDDIYSEDSHKVAAVARILKTKHEQFQKAIKPSEPHTTSSVQSLS